MRVWLTLIAILTIGLFTLQSLAGETCTGAKSASAKAGSCSGSCGGACGDKAKSATASAKEECETKTDDCLTACPGEIAAAAPKMTFVVVNDSKTLLTTQCPCSAKKAAAEKAGSTITFKVDKAEFTNEKDAYKAYAKQLENYLGTMTKVEYVVGSEKTCCPDTAASMAKKNKSKIQYRVASVSFPNAELASAAAKQAQKAIEGVQMKYVVAGKEFTCPKEAGASCDKSKAKMAYKIGENTTESEFTAQTALLRERINAAAEVVAKTAKEGSASAKAS